eukprot:COSAG02_NODE_1113_length_14503_cov_87.812205_9_plen_76_part_00
MVVGASAGADAAAPLRRCGELKLLYRGVPTQGTIRREQADPRANRLGHRRYGLRRQAVKDSQCDAATECTCKALV